MSGPLRNGFTLIELMVTVAVLAIIIAFAVPSFVNLVENSRVTTQANTLLAAMNLARSEAIKQGVPVSVQNKPADFSAGWCVFAGDLAANNICSGAVIKQFPALDRVSLSQGGLKGITFDGRGYRAVPEPLPLFDEVKIELQPPNCVAGSKRMRVVMVSPAGRATVGLEECN